jgi:uncharacterized protein (DUF1800 family)
MLTRRDFHAMVIAAAAVGSAKQPGAQAAAPTGGNDMILNRLTFGADEVSRANLARDGFETWLNGQLAGPAEDEDLKARLSSARLMMEYEAGTDDTASTWQARKEHLPYQYLNVRGEKLVPLVSWDKGKGVAWEERIRPAREVQAAALIRAVHGQGQLREMMTQFWHDHFNVNAMRDEHTAAFFAVHDKVLRDNAFGNFRVLLGAVTKSPAMLYYLNNDASRASPANENFARELFELHTFGAMHYMNDTTTNWHDVPGAKDGLAQGYIDQDVYEAARVLTGWSVGDGRWVAEGENAPRTGEFQYIDRWHDPYQKRILGVEFRANDGPMADGETLLDILAGHQSTAKHLCLKLCRRLVSDDPPDSLVSAAVDVWMKHSYAPDQIAKVVRTIALSPEFAATPPRKLKRPFEFLTSFYRATRAEVASPGITYIWMLSRAGWNQHECRPPTGHADVTEHWATTATISSYADLALNALEEWSAAGRVNFSDLVPAGAVSMAQGHQHITHKFTGKVVAEAECKAVAKLFMQDEAAMLPDDKEGREWFIRGLVASAALNPQFLFR